MDRKHNQAIVREIGKQLRLTFKEGQVLPPALRMQLERLRQSEDAQYHVVKCQQNSLTPSESPAVMDRRANANTG
jgi:hypothetical protein